MVIVTITIDALGTTIEEVNVLEAGVPSVIDGHMAAMITTNARTTGLAKDHSIPDAMKLKCPSYR